MQSGVEIGVAPATAGGHISEEGSPTTSAGSVVGPHHAGTSMCASGGKPRATTERGVVALPYRMGGVDVATEAVRTTTLFGSHVAFQQTPGAQERIGSR